MLVAKLSADKKKLVIEIDANVTNPAPSKSSGKTLVVASSHGNKETEVEINGKRLYIGLNAYVYAV